MQNVSGILANKAPLSVATTSALPLRTASAVAGGWGGWGGDLHQQGNIEFVHKGGVLTQVTSKIYGCMKQFHTLRLDWTRPDALNDDFSLTDWTGSDAP